MRNKALWFQVLCHFDDNNYYENGLTIPFLLGANTIINIEKELLTVENFFYELIDETLPRKISMLRCSEIGAYVFGIMSKESLNYPYATGKTIYKQIGNLYITDNSFSDIEDADIKSELINEYQGLIDLKKYSTNRGNWGEYSKTEIERLVEIR